MWIFPPSSVMPFDHQLYHWNTVKQFFFFYIITLIIFIPIHLWSLLSISTPSLLPSPNQHSILFGVTMGAACYPLVYLHLPVCVLSSLDSLFLINLFSWWFPIHVIWCCRHNTITKLRRSLLFPALMQQRAGYFSPRTKGKHCIHKRHDDNQVSCDPPCLPAMPNIVTFFF